MTDVPRRKLGSTDLEVSVLGFGAATLGDLYGTMDDDGATRTVRHAIDRGITLFDCSPYYGITLAEERLGRALTGVRDRVELMTKCGRYDVDDFDFSKNRIVRSVDESLQRLGTDWLDVFFAHDVEFGDADQIVEETIPALHEIKQSGKARYVGITGLPVTYLRSLAERAPVDVILSYCRANLLDHGAVRVLAPFCREHGVGLVNASPLHMGILSGVAFPDWHPSPPEIRALGPELARLSKSRGHDLSKVALSYALQLDGPDATLCGMKSVDEVDSNVEAVGYEVPSELRKEIESAIGDLADYTWLQGRPENSSGPGEAKFR